MGHDECATCHELLGPHSGAATGARHTPWTGQLFARALNELSMGASYASTSMMMRRYRDRAREHLLEAHDEDLTTIQLNPGASGTGSSYVAREAKSAWHLAADLVEQYSPLIWNDVNAQLQQRDRRQREHNDQLLATSPGARLPAPVTWVLDEQPVEVIVRRPDRRRRRVRWFVLVVVEVRWHQGPDKDSYPQREYRLRLMRAYPRANEEAWRLVFDEVGVRPDFAVADHAGAIGNALDRHFGAGVVGSVPSMFHMRRNLRKALLSYPTTTTTVQGRKVLVDPIAKHLDALNREDLAILTTLDWTRWWDELQQTVQALGAPTAGIASQRQVYEPRVAQAMPLLAAQPYLPASNAAVENRIRHPEPQDTPLPRTGPVPGQRPDAHPTVNGCEGRPGELGPVPQPFSVSGKAGRLVDGQPARDAMPGGNAAGEDMVHSDALGSRAHETGVVAEEVDEQVHGHSAD